MAEVVFECIAPVVRVREVQVALPRSARLGFDTELDEPAGYGFVRHGPVELYLVPDDPDDPGATGGVVYLDISDAETLHHEWTSAGVECRVLARTTPRMGFGSFVYTDPDGIVHPVGSPLGWSASGVRTSPGCPTALGVEHSRHVRDDRG